MKVFELSVQKLEKVFLQYKKNYDFLRNEWNTATEISWIKVFLKDTWGGSLENNIG